ncbi:MAG: hypothetical protein P8M67_04640 [Opitutales bacterium]|nr:hypothetical protein [Opitutales bacterium]
MIIGLAGVARSGKDSFFNFCQNTKVNGKTNLRFAFADELKSELDQFILKEFNISSFTECSREKEIIRPILVSYGMAKRKISEGKYWVEKVKSKIEFIKDSHNCFITDVRFSNEVDQIKKLGGICIHIERFNNPPANEEEKNEDPIVKSKSDYHFKWGDFSQNTSPSEIAINFLKEKL